ncbi:MAG: hypothetical protein AABN95_05625 [Acidobacteriota bacterium]
MPDSSPPESSGDSSLDIPRKPKPEDFERPVAWLFGLQFIANLKWLLMYAAFKGKLDARDWMKPEIIPSSQTAADVDQFWRKWNETWKESENGNPESEKEFWFDYISDTGDGQKAMYSIAYLCLSDFAVSKSQQLDELLEFVLEPLQLATGKRLLPRGTFLFVGGDTSYHISDYGTLARRFQNPFWWAFADLKGQARSVMVNVPRLLLGIPGNHDYYDSLDGFNRQFRRPATEDKIVAGKRPPLLMLPTFRRRQEASFLALRLPFDWWFWGLDTEEGEIDFRQLEFFKDIQDKYSPHKLIVATPQPTTAFGKFASEEEHQSRTFKALKLERPFLKKSEPLGKGKCRVDLSGDIHHYARYWGPPPASEITGNYSSVMAGGGGAFFHPSHTNVREVRQQVLYPQASVSRNRLADELFKFLNIFNGGYIWLFGLLIAFSLFFAASFPQSTKDAFNSFPPWIELGIAPFESQAPESPTAFGKTMPRSNFGPDTPLKPSLFYPWISSLVGSLILLVTALVYSKKLFKKEYDPEETKPKKKITGAQRFTVWALVFLAFGGLLFGVLGFRNWETNITRYGRSLIILVALLWALLALIQSLKYSGWLFEEARYENIKAWHYWPIWILLLMAFLGFAMSLWFFGRQEAAYLISDLVHFLVLLAVGLGLMYFAYSTGASLKKGIGKIGFLLLGASLALLIIAVPFLYVRKGHLLWALLALLFIVIVFKYVGRLLARLENGWPLAIAWIIFGAGLLATPFVLHAGLWTPGLFSDILPSPAIFDGLALNMPEDRWAKFFLCFLAAAIGAVMSCVLFGWYLAVSLAFNGHNNEAGGAARIEGFKHLIRFRINRQGLTGFVIAIDKPNTTGGTGHLEPRLVDVFNVRE